MRPENLWPHDHEPYTDRYFRRSKKILEEEGINPTVSFKIFCRESFELDLQGIIAIVKLLEAMPTKNTRFHVREPGHYGAGEPLVLYEGPAQELIDLETVLLGSLSHILENRYGEVGGTPWPQKFKKNAKGAIDYYSQIDVPMLYFGARHYPWWKDKELAAAALAAGCVQTSTDIGSYNIYKRGVGTTPHALTIILAHEHGEKQATLATAMAFDDHMADDVPRTILCDTFNREVDDTLLVLEELVNERGLPAEQCGVRIDTCGENIAQSGRQQRGEDPHRYMAGSGVTIESVRNLRLQMNDAGFEDAQLFVSSGMGNPHKAHHFTKAAKRFEEEEKGKMFNGVGAGSFVDTIQCTADIYRVNDEWLAKAGREVHPEELSVFDFYTLQPERDPGLPNIDMIK